MRHRKTRMIGPQIISEGTLRPEDLIPAYLDVLEGLRLTREERQTVREVRAASEHEGYYDGGTGQIHNVPQCHGCGWRGQDQTTREAAEVEHKAHACAREDCFTATWHDLASGDPEPPEDLDELASIIDAHCAPYCYFGSHPGDGACFGVWVAHEMLEEGIWTGEVWKDPDDGSTMPKEARYRLVVPDHGNMSLYHRNGRVVWEVV